jgi:sulfoxide reductase catalytic subunit YedY
MYFRRKPSWFLPESAATPESDYRRRREFLRRAGLGTGLLLSGAATAALRAATAGFPVDRSEDFNGEGLDLTDEALIKGYNNFYEFGTGKDDPQTYANQGWKTEPWTLTVDGLVRESLTIEVNDLVRKIGGLEERVYRMRCVEAWSMVIPWVGFPLAKLLQLVEPKAEAKYVRFESFLNPEEAPGQRGNFIDWPYVEGLRLDEARHDLTMLVTGLYGKPLPNQNGAPIRLVVPWKYGFKGAKSLVRISLTDKQPLNTWQALQPSEYGFYANVNPKVDHPRWSQASERIIGGGFFSSRKPTLMFNGYEKEVASLYEGMDLKKNF